MATGPQMLSSEAAAPLVLELARSLRSRQFYAPADEGLREALRRVARVWRAGLPAGAVLELFVLDESFGLADGGELDDPALGDLIGELRRREVTQIRIAGGLDPREIVILVSALTAPVEPGEGAQEFERRLREAGARSISVTPPGAASEAPAASERSDAPPPHDGIDTQELVATLTVQLIRELGELEQVEDVASYNLLSNRIEITMDSLLREKNPVDAYRAVLAYTRHATDPAIRGPQIHREAGERLRRLMLGEALMEYTVDQACRSAGLASVQATQVLLAVGETAMPRLVALLADSDPGVAEQASSIVVTLGERSLAPLVAELECDEAGRARRAARLLGDLQHPGAVQALASALGATDRGVRAESAKSLARIGNSHAVHALVEGLDDAPEEMARLLVSNLGGSRHPSALRALREVASGRREMSDEVSVEAIRSLGRQGDPAAVPVLVEILDHRGVMGRARWRPRRIAAAQALGRIGGPDAYQALERNVRRGDTSVGDACRRAIQGLASD